VSALTSATASLILDPSNVKAWYRRATALWKLNKRKAGLAACEQATKLLNAQGKDNSEFKSLIKAMTEAETALVRLRPRSAQQNRRVCSKK
jgi:hypothetical protein